MANMFKPTIIGLRNDTLAPFAGNYRMSTLVDHRPERHCHDYYELYIHLRGGQYYSMEDQLKELSPNMLIIAPPFCMHGIIHDRNLICYERVFVDISTQMLEEAGSRILNLTEMLQNAVSGGNYFFQMTDEDAQVCKDIVMQMNQARAQRTALGNFDAYVCLLRYLQIVCHTIKDATPATAAPTTYPLMQQVLLYLDAHFTEPLSLQDVAKAFNISVSYLSHEFVRYNKRSVYDYVLYRRVMMACELVKKGSNLTNAAYKCGFNNYNTFMRAFKKIVGMSPSDYYRQDANLSPFY